ncbi:MAG: polysaccharide deacetylase family protein [Desulfovibrio sp.]|jgi:peptidoglycan/xylan/chitin deacetylase (PgdA/CDA1 family)|nr:polysaccharide deacetylase family protein [Desulfovibrio sp.]
MKGRQARSLPVVMYHYVSDHENTNSVSRLRFEEHCRVLAENGWRGIGLDEAVAFLKDGVPLAEKSVLLTFDDGYLDNYLHALPLLRRFGHKGVMFAVANRLERETIPRESLSDVLAGRHPLRGEVNFPVRENELGHRVRRDIFCNLGEARAMEESGVMAVAAHGRGHYGVYLGPEFTGFLKPGRQPRTFFLTEDPPVWGLPAFAVKPGLRERAFLPNPELVRSVAGLVPQDYREADRFFSRPENVKALRRLVETFAGRLGRFETDRERQERMWREIALGKEELETALGHGLEALCWPWGAWSPEALSLAREAGFSVFLTTREGTNPPGKPLEVHRFKGRNREGRWLISRLGIYSRPWLGGLYARLRL